jgi:hypothetical protein
MHPLGSVCAQAGILAQTANGHGIQNKEKATEDESHCSDALHGWKSRYTVIHWGYIWGYYLGTIFQAIHLLDTYKQILILQRHDFPNQLKLFSEQQRNGVLSRRAIRSLNENGLHMEAILQFCRRSAG